MGKYGQFDSDYFGFNPDFQLQEQETGNSSSESNTTKTIANTPVENINKGFYNVNMGRE